MNLPEGTIISAGPVIIENGKALLNRERSETLPNKEHFFMFPGGRYQTSDQTLENTCRREAKEELGIDIEFITPMRTLILPRLHHPDKPAILVHYLSKRIGKIVPGKETAEWGWYDIHNLPKNCTPNVYEIINDYINEYGE